MKNITKYLVSVSSVTLLALAAAPAYAAGTDAGISITNSVTVEYQVSSIDQDDVIASDAFVVDRAINVIVAEVGNVTTTVTPGEQDAVTTFDVTNETNGFIDIALAVSQIVGGTASHGGTDTFDVTTVEIYVDEAAGNGTYDGTETQVTFLDEMGNGETRRIFVVADVPTGLATNDVADVELTGTAREGNNGTLGGAVGGTITATTGGDTAGVDTVFADADGVFDGVASDDDDYTVVAASLSALKGSTVTSANYPITGATEFYNIPGATVEYCIAVTNAAGGADATNVTITDAVPTNTTFVAGSIVIGGTATIDDGGTPGNPADDTLTSCDNSSGTPGGSFSGGNVTASLGTVSAGTTEIVTFRAVID